MGTWRIGRYEILERLAAGGMGEVFLAHAPGVRGFAKRVVVKRIFPERNNDADYRRLFVREAKVAASLTHPNIVQVFDLGEDGDDLYLVMELVEGCDLDDLLHDLAGQRRKLPWEIVAVLADDVLGALDFAHTQRDASGNPRPIVHQDLSPQNVLVSLQGHAKLCDFGVARILGITTTVHASARGKLAYMAPEQVNAELTDARTDLYSLGLVLYEAMSGVSPYAGRSFASLLEQTAAMQVTPLGQVAPDQDPALCEIIDRALTWNPDKRYASAATFRAALVPIMRRLSPTSVRQRLRTFVAEVTALEGPSSEEPSRRTVGARWGSVVPAAKKKTVVAKAPPSSVAEEPSASDITPLHPPPPFVRKRVDLMFPITLGLAVLVGVGLALWLRL